MTNKKREILSNNLRYYMKIKGMTRKKLSDETEIAYTTIRDYEKGICYAKMDNIKKIAEKLDISPLMLTEEHNISQIMNIVDDSKDSQLMLEIMIKLSKLSLEGKQYILNSIDVISNLQK